MTRLLIALFVLMALLVAVERWAPQTTQTVNTAAKADRLDAAARAENGGQP